MKKSVSLICSLAAALLVVSCQQKEPLMNSDAGDMNRCGSCRTSPAAATSHYVGDLADHYRFCPACPEHPLMYRAQPGT